MAKLIVSLDVNKVEPEYSIEELTKRMELIKSIEMNLVNNEYIFVWFKTSELQTIANMLGVARADFNKVAQAVKDHYKVKPNV